ncbi:MAG: zinc ribbon domain-containing protein [Allomuricauda sp.]
MVTETKELEERSDFLEKDQIQDWFISSEYFDNIQRKLIGTGAKLLIGPRGTGKTHQMLAAHFKCLKDKSKPVSLYVSFNRYYHLEPLLSRAPNAIKVFNTWVLSKIVLSIVEFCEYTSLDPSSVFDNITFGKSKLEEFVGQAEKGYYRFENEELISKINVSIVQSFIEKLITISGRRRAIVFLDDAALTLTPDYLVEFFEVFVGLKSIRISPKASVYPGTTEYGTKFHLGHDAEKVECWINVSQDIESYSAFMDQLIEKRLKSVISDIDSDIIELLKFASFGIPRAFLFLVRSFQQSNKSTRQSKFNEVIDLHSELIKAEYLSLSKKIPQFSNIINVGYQFFESVISLVSTTNKNLNNEKNLIIGLKKDSNRMIERMTQFLNEAGLLYKYSSNVSHGNDREYERYSPHLLFLIKERAFATGRGFDSKYMLTKLLSPERKQPVRRKYDTLIKQEELDKLNLNLPPCNNCGTVRIQDDQRFCHKCGAELIVSSAFENCMELDVSEIPFTPFQLKAVKEANFTKIKDFYSVQNPGSELRKVKKVGVKRSGYIIELIDKVVDEFLT